MNNLFYNVSMPKGIITDGISSSDNINKPETNSNIEIVSNQEYSYTSIEHSDAKPLTEEQKQKKHSAYQKQLDKIAKMKRAGQTISSSIPGANGSTLTKLETYDKNGELKIVQTKRSDGSISFTAEYDNGKQIRQEAYFEDGTLSSKSEFKDGKLIKEISYDPDGSGMIASSTSYEYYPNGNLKSEVKDDPISPAVKQYYENGTLKLDQSSISISEYDDTGKLLKQTFNSPNENKFTSSITYFEYDKEGREISSSKYSKDGKTLISKSETQYTQNKTSTIVYDTSDKEIFRSEEETMPDGSIIRRENNKFVDRIKVVDNEIDKEIYHYTEDGKLIAYQIPYENAESGYIDDKFYDGNGKEISYDDYEDILKSFEK